MQEGEGGWHGAGINRGQSLRDMRYRAWLLGMRVSSGGRGHGAEPVPGLSGVPRVSQGAIPPQSAEGGNGRQWKAAATAPRCLARTCCVALPC